MKEKQPTASSSQQDSFKNGYTFRKVLAARMELGEADGGSLRHHRDSSSLMGTELSRQILQGNACH